MLILRLRNIGLPLFIAASCLILTSTKLVASKQLTLLSNDGNIAAIEALQTPANGCFSFFVIGDNRGGDKVYASLITQMDTYARQHKKGDRPLFALHTGDIVPHGTRSEWEHYARMRERLSLPMVYVRGNHELKSAEGPGNYLDLVGPLNWTFDFGGCRFIGLDNATHQFSESSVEFLKRQLGAKKPAHVFVAFHEPPHVGRWVVHSVDSDSAGGRGGEVLAALTKYGASAVFLGHIHLFDEMELDGVPYIISGGGGAPLYSSYGFGKPEHGYVVVHVTPKAVSWDWVPLAK